MATLVEMLANLPVWYGNQPTWKKILFWLAMVIVVGGIVAEMILLHFY